MNHFLLPTCWLAAFFTSRLTLRDKFFWPWVVFCFLNSDNFFWTDDATRLKSLANLYKDRTAQCLRWKTNSFYNLKRSKQNKSKMSWNAWPMVPNKCHIRLLHLLQKIKPCMVILRKNLMNIFFVSLLDALNIFKYRIFVCFNIFYTYLF